MQNPNHNSKHQYKTRLAKSFVGSLIYLEKLNKYEHVKNHKKELLKQPALTKYSRTMYTPDKTTIYFNETNEAEYYAKLSKQTPKKPKRRSTSRKTKDTPTTNESTPAEKEAEVSQTPSYGP